MGAGARWIQRRRARPAASATAVWAGAEHPAAGAGGVVVGSPWWSDHRGGRKLYLNVFLVN